MLPSTTSPGVSPRLGQARVLIMEDEVFVALDLSDLAAQLGYEVSGPFASLADGLAHIGSQRPDAAILDVQLIDGEVFPLADALERMGVPIIFHSGHANDSALRARYPDSRSAEKPCPAKVIADYLREATAHPVWPEAT